MARTLLLALSIGLGVPAAAHADDERALTSLDLVHDGCRDAEMHPARDLLTIEVEPGWTFGALDEDGFLAIQPRRAFRALAGRVELFAAHLETIGLVATPERAQELEAARAQGARLRIGFFLGYDEPDRTACLIRSRHAVTTVRMDVAYVELLASDGGVLAREDSDRFRAWQDDRDRSALPGTGPRAAIADVSAASGTVPEAWEPALASALQGDVGRAIAECHRAGVARGAEASARVVLRVRVDGRTGRVAESALAISDLGDSDEGECVATAMRAATLPPGPPATIDLSVAIRLAH